LGFPFLAKFAQYFCIISLTWRSLSRQVTSVFESSCPKTYSISAEWYAPSRGAFGFLKNGAMSNR